MTVQIEDKAFEDYEAAISFALNEMEQNLRRSTSINIKVVYDSVKFAADSIMKGTIRNNSKNEDLNRWLGL